MRFSVFVAALLISPLALALGPGRAYLDMEDGEFTSVFSKPGVDWKSCKEDPNCEAVGWPDNSAELDVISSVRKMQMIDAFDQITTGEFVLVRFKYTRNGFTKTGEGWIDAARLTNRKQNTFFGEAITAPDPDCPPNAAPPRTEQSTVAPIAELQRALTNRSVRDIAQSLHGKVGTCVIDPKRVPAQYAQGIPYDNYVLPHLRRTSVPSVVREDGQRMTQQDLIDIDALARTLYAEMANCFKHGLQYPMTVARISVNRAEAEGRHREFIKGNHNGNKSSLARVTTSPVQFSAWNRQIRGQRNPSLAHALCPPSDKDKNFWRGHTPSQEELDIWENTLRIATETVLFPQKFKSRTSQVSQFHYTSGMSGFYNMRQSHPTIEGRRVSRNACVQVWNEQ